MLDKNQNESLVATDLIKEIQAQFIHLKLVEE